MQTQLILFLRPAEMLIFNSLFDSVAKGKKGRTISLTRQNFEKLREAVNEAQGEAPAEKFIEDCVTAIAGNGLIERVEGKSANLPIGVWRARVAKDVIIGPDYIVEKGLFKIIVAFKPKSTPPSASVSTAEAGEELVDFDRIIIRQGDLSTIDMLVVFAGLSPWAYNWFSVPEFFSFLKRRMKYCPLTLSRVEQTLLSYSRRQRDPFRRNDFIPREDKDLKYCLSRVGMSRFFELIRSLYH